MTLIEVVELKDKFSENAGWRDFHHSGLSLHKSAIGHAKSAVRQLFTKFHAPRKPIVAKFV